MSCSVLKELGETLGESETALILVGRGDDRGGDQAGERTL